MARINNVDIQSVAFAPGQVEVTYAEQRDIDSPSGILEIRTMVIPVDVVEEAVIEVLDAALQLVDAAQVALRNPVAVLRKK